MYSILLHTHNGFRWIVLLTLVIAFVLATSGWFRKKGYKKSNRIINLLLLIFTDLQFLTGLILYVFVSPVTKVAFNDFGTTMKDSELRFYAVEHFLLMTLAIVFIHIGYAKTKKFIEGWEKNKAVSVFFGTALLLILLAIPWNRAFF